MRHGMMPQLAVFEAVGRLGSFTRAAEELFMAQPTVSIHIKKLSETLGLTLIEQVGKKLVLTEAGRELSQACQDIFGRLSTMEDKLAGLRDLDHGRLRIAVSSAGKYFVPRLLGGFCARHPNIEVAMHVDNWTGIRARMQEFADDLYILSMVPQSVELKAYPVLPNPIEVFAPANHPLAKARNIAFAQLADEPFILRESGSATRRITQELFAKYDITPRVRLELASNEAIKQAVIAGLGIALLSRYIVGLDIHNPGLCTLDVQNFPVMQQWFVVHPAGKQLPQVASAFLDHIRANADTDVLSHLEDTHSSQGGASALAAKMAR
jgi:DNA-binding transcriptional LysR family regulator